MVCGVVRVWIAALSVSAFPESRDIAFIGGGILFVLLLLLLIILLIVIMHRYIKSAFFLKSRSI